MLHYIDIHLRPDPEFPAHQLMAALYGKLHRALVLSRSSRVGVVFPGYGVSPPGLGDTLRLFGPAEDLAGLMRLDWLQGMRDHVTLAAPGPVPAHAEPCRLQRVQAKSSPERLRRRQMRRHGMTAEQARERVPDAAAEKLALPFLVVTSASTGQRFRLFLRLDQAPLTRLATEFNAYGLAQDGGVPCF